MNPQRNDGSLCINLQEATATAETGAGTGAKFVSRKLVGLPCIFHGVLQVLAKDWVIGLLLPLGGGESFSYGTSKPMTTQGSRLFKK